MPTYDYQCASCGPFSVVRSMADYAKPAACDLCGADSPRAFFTAPAVAGVGNIAGRRAAAINERSRHEPRRARSHPAGCGCCSQPSRSAATAAKSFPGARPWMISH